MTQEDSGQIFFKIGDLSEKLGVESHVLRFWEKEFPQIKPLKVGAKKRLYRPQELALFQEIKRLLYEERYTIAGARKKLESGTEAQKELLFTGAVGNVAEVEKNLAEPQAAASDRREKVLSDLKNDLTELRKFLLLKNFAHNKNKL